ncbi:MAG: DUF4115 domain-containing protein [Rugosibacter sp.]|nr:DUF4115 domain-containing protein [Rugosibacter sp.]
MNEDFSQLSVTEASAENAFLGASLPGAALRAQRESQGLTAEAIARVTRFSVRQVDALERDDYGSLPGMTTVRGFVRSYAKCLQVDAAPFLGALDVVAPSTTPEVCPPGNMGEAGQDTGVPRRMVTYLIAAGVVALLILAVYVFLVTQQGYQPALLVPNLPKNDQQSQALPINGPAALPTLPETVEMDTSGAAVDPIAVAATAVSPPASAALNVVFDGMSWIEVRDATQKIILSGEFPAGATQTVEGESPFHVWVGKASVVRIVFGGRSIDLQPFTRADVARLTVE